ncbi:hypothetical protein WAK64_01945 [Bacillus spongiae]|uniref:LysM domain-containing protein n=1 Tax=Bacillus spongiae TaxID=2683610 RepID=A0ABU8H948_9BACI
MKGLAIFIIILVVVYSIYFDLRYGTLQADDKQKDNPTTAQAVSSNPSLNFFKKKIQPGDTVLSIIEEEMNSTIPVPIEQVIADFRYLNNGVAPEKIQLGKVYLIPIY